MEKKSIKDILDNISRILSDTNDYENIQFIETSFGVRIYFSFDKEKMKKDI